MAGSVAVRVPGVHPPDLAVHRASGDDAALPGSQRRPARVRPPVPPREPAVPAVRLAAAARRGAPAHPGIRGSLRGRLADRWVERRRQEHLDDARGPVGQGRGHDRGQGRPGAGLGSRDEEPPVRRTPAERGRGGPESPRRAAAGPRHLQGQPVRVDVRGRTTPGVGAGIGAARAGGESRPRDRERGPGGAVGASRGPRSLVPRPDGPAVAVRPIDPRSGPRRGAVRVPVPAGDLRPEGEARVRLLRVPDPPRRPRRRTPRSGPRPCRERAAGAGSVRGRGRAARRRGPRSGTNSTSSPHGSVPTAWSCPRFLACGARARTRGGRRGGSTRSHPGTPRTPRW